MGGRLLPTPTQAHGQRAATTLRDIDPDGIGSVPSMEPGEDCPTCRVGMVPLGPAPDQSRWYWCADCDIQYIRGAGGRLLSFSGGKFSPSDEIQRKIAGLTAKAASTTFVAERDALLAKASQLRSKHSGPGYGPVLRPTD